jgi:hypothetical protein
MKKKWMLFFLKTSIFLLAAQAGITSINANNSDAAENIVSIHNLQMQMDSNKNISLTKKEDKDDVDKKSSDGELLRNAVMKLDFAKIFFVVAGCIFTTMISLIGESLVKKTMTIVRETILDAMVNKQAYDNISSDEIIAISNAMKNIIKDIKATRLSLFRLDGQSHVLFREISSQAKYSLSSNPPVAKQFFDSAILPMIKSDQCYSYCGDRGEICTTWLDARGTGSYAIHLFFCRDNLNNKVFSGFILAEWNRNYLIDSILKTNKDSDYLRLRLKELSDMISNAIKNKN